MWRPATTYGPPKCRYRRRCDRPARHLGDGYCGAGIDRPRRHVGHHAASHQTAWGVGSRTQWDVTKTFYLGVEVLYSGMRSAQTGCGNVLPGTCPGGVGGTSVSFGNAGLLESSASNWMVSVRAHRDFLP